VTVPVLLLHPLGSDGSFFDPLRSYLEDTVALAPDLLGHGRSERSPASPTLTDYAEDIIGHLDRAGHGVVDVVGVSLGALVAATLAGEFPHRIGKVVLADCVPEYPPGMVAMWGERAAAAESSGLGAFIGPTMSLWFNDGFLDDHPDLAYIRQVLETTDPRGYADACRVLASADVRAQVAAMSNPTLVVCGSDDAEPFRHGAEWLGRNIPDARVAWIRGGRHACFFENAAAVALTVTDFLSIGTMSTCGHCLQGDS
jgi:3-oxoadipate enol-lactonase